LFVSYSCPSLIAKAKTGSDFYDIIKTHIRLDPVLQSNCVDDKNIAFVGMDAHQTAYSYPNVTLREALDIHYPLQEGLITDADGFVMLLDHSLDHTYQSLPHNMTDGGFQIIYSYKPTIQSHDVNVIADALFGRSDQNIIRCEGVCMYNEVVVVCCWFGARVSYCRPYWCQRFYCHPYK